MAHQDDVHSNQIIDWKDACSAERLTSLAVRRMLQSRRLP